MSGLNEAQIARYHERGYVVPEFALNPAEVTTLRDAVDQLIENNPQIRPEHLVNAHIAKENAEGVQGIDAVLAFTSHPRVLDLVESILGPDIILWGCQVFCKPAGDGMEVPWHQDGQYWPIRPLATCTVWIAIDDSEIENGCLRVIPGSHSQQQVFSHRTDERERITLTQTVDDEHMRGVEEVDIELKAGQMSLHDVYLIHGSNPNNSARRRAGIAIRYFPGTSVFRRDVIEPSADAGFMVDFSRRPLWLLRGEDKTGKNDFKVGHD